MDDSTLPHHGWCGLGTLEVLCVQHRAAERAAYGIYGSKDEAYSAFLSVMHARRFGLGRWRSPFQMRGTSQRITIP